MAVYGIKPLSLKHLDLSDIQVRDFWLKYSECTTKRFVVQHWDSICNAMKFKKVTFDGKRKFINVAMGQVSKLMHWKKLASKICPVCDRGYRSTEHVLFDPFQCSACQIRIQGVCPTSIKQNEWTEENRIFVDCCKVISDRSFFFKDWRFLD